MCDKLNGINTMILVDEAMKKIYNEKIEKLLTDSKRTLEINEENLIKILSDNKKTIYGKKYRFCEISDGDYYAKRVPLSEYSDYEEGICIENEFVTYPIKYIMGTSGTTGKQKFFPLTEVAIERYSSYIYDMQYHITDVKGKSLHTSVFRSPGGNTILSSGYFSYLADNGDFDCDDFVGGRELLFSDKITNVKYVKAWLLLSHSEIVSIQSIFLYDILLIFSYLEENWQTLISDMRNKSVSVSLDENIKEELYRNSVSEERLLELEKIFGCENGFLVADILPDLRFISGIGGKIYELQGEALKRYIGDIPIHYFAYASSECMMGVATELNKAEYMLLPRSAYYEFLPLDSNNVHKMNDIVIGKSYELVITTFSGLYRYKTGDIIKILSFEGESPVFQIEGRRNSMLNIAGEKLPEQIIRDAVKIFGERSNAHIWDFATGIKDDKTPFGYAIFIETDSVIEDSDKLFDSILCEFSFDYEDVRSLGMISLPCVYCVKKGEISRVCLQQKEGMAHNKPSTFLESKQIKELIKSAKEVE